MRLAPRWLAQDLEGRCKEPLQWKKVAHAKLVYAVRIDYCRHISLNCAIASILRLSPKSIRTKQTNDLTQAQTHRHIRHRFALVVRVLLKSKTMST